jgi:hypothetical protein
MSIGALVLGLLGFFGGIIPFVGFLGLIAVGLGLYDLKRAKTDGVPEKHGLSTAGIILGGISSLGGVAWVVFSVWFVESASKGSCPHLYAWDGEHYQLDADLVSGALYKGAEREDMDRLESLKAVDGVYRVRVQDDLQEQDNVDSLSLLVVDAPSTTTVLPMQSGELAFASALAAPLSRAQDSGTFENGEPRESWTFTFARPAGKEAVLVLRARTSPFAEKAFVEYMATMGQATRPLLEFRARDNCSCFREYMNAEMDRLGLPLTVTVGSSSEKLRVDPIGPAILRNQAISITLPEGGNTVAIRLDGTPEFWDLDGVMLGTKENATAETTILRPARASSTFPIGDVKKKLTTDDEDRVSLAPGQYADVEFDEPAAPAAGMRRTVIAKLRGYYDLDIGGRAGANIPRMVAHRAGVTSLPRFAARMRGR